MTRIKPRYPLVAAGLLLTNLLVGCGSEEEVLGGVCPAVDGSAYYSTTLNTGGATPSGVSLMHWQMRFDEGRVELFQYDYIVTGSYDCGDGDVIVTLEGVSQSLESEDAFESFTWLSDNEEIITYRRQAEKAEAADCASVAGRRYVDPDGSDVYIDFSEGQSVEWLLGSETVSGLFDCDTAALHLHRSADDEQPLQPVMAQQGDALTLTADGQEWRLVADDSGTVCTEIYEPVCGAEKRDTKCSTESCNDRFYKTFSNACYARRDDAEVLFEGECGELEGQPVENEIACPAVVEPVCAMKTSTEPCLSVPCPSATFATYNNACEAERDGARVLFEEPCGDREDQPVSDLSPWLACTLEFDPVCAKDLGGVQCVTTPCETHEYRTFGNACSASVSRANVVAPEACPESIEGKAVTGEPPVVMSEELPETDKGVTVIESSIEGDILTATLGYSGCDQQHFTLTVGEAFMESDPVQVRYEFVPMVNDLCDAYFETELRYDLMSLQIAFKQSYPSAEGVVALPGLGTYRF